MSYVINSSGCSCRKKRRPGCCHASDCMCPNGCPEPRVRNVVYTGPCPPAPDHPCQPPLPPSPPDPPCYRPLNCSACCNDRND